MRIKKLIARLFDLPNAFRVLDIMDKAGCDIVQKSDTRWAISPKWFVSRKDAEDLQKIVLHKEQYKPRSKLWYRLVFRNVRTPCRPSECWYHGEQ